MSSGHPPRIGVRKWVDGALFAPNTKYQWFAYWAVVVLILTITAELAIFSQYPAFYAKHAKVFEHYHLVITAIFTVELCLRIWCRPLPRDYLLSWQGAFDLLAIIPAWIAMALGIPATNVLWLRGLRLLRLLRAASLLYEARRLRNPHMEVLSRLAPIFAIVIAVKTTMLYLETAGLWPSFHGFEPIITVIGFSIGILLSSRLATVHARIYAFDQAIEALVGSVEAARAHVDNKPLIQWLSALHESILSGKQTESFAATSLALRTTIGAAIPAPIYNAMQRDAHFILHRAQTQTPRVYTLLLMRLTTLYMFVLMTTIPGVTGLFSVLLAVYALGGMSIIVDAMDKPFDVSDDSFVNADISGLETYLHDNPI